MYPRNALAVVALIWAIAGIATIVDPSLMGTWLSAGTLILLIVGLDYVMVSYAGGLHATRKVANTNSVGVFTPVTVTLENHARRTAKYIQVHDHVPVESEVQGLPAKLDLAGGNHAEITYQYRPLERGPQTFEHVQVVLRSPLGLWHRSIKIGTPETVRVYPNFANIAKYTLLATDNRLSQMGILIRRRRGDGMEFQQLRDYIPGDALRKIDWKASARMRKLISRQYQDERDQQVLIALDCSRRMQAKDDELSHFDHALNALLLLTYVAGRQGDSVALQCFGGSDRALAGRKGSTAINGMLNTVYDLQPQANTADYRELAKRIMSTQKRRSLVIILTNLRDEEGEELKAAMRLLRSRHLVMVANLREGILDETLAEPVTDDQSAATHGAVTQYLELRAQANRQLELNGTILLDVLPEDLLAAVVNQYLEVKASGNL